MMKHENNANARRIMFLVMFTLLTGCIHSIGRTSSPTDGTDIAKTLSAMTKSSNLQVTTNSPASGLILMSSGISSGYAVYSVAISREPFVSQIFLKNLGTGEVTQLTRTGNNSRPHWSPDGSQIVYSSWTEENSFDIYLMDKDGKNQQPIIASLAMEISADWSPDGNKIAYVSNIDGDDAIYTLNLKTHISAKLPITPPVGIKFQKWIPILPKWSPNGKQIAFVSGTGTSGRSQIFIMNIDGTGVVPITDYDLHYDDVPVWCPDSSCVIFARVENGPQLMKINLTTMQEYPLLNNIFPHAKSQYNPSRSQNYITFSIEGSFYAIDIKNGKIFPLNIEASDLSLYP
jgi:Tol biopolymer transport system component